MGTGFTRDYLKELSKPFAAQDLEWRIQSSGFKQDRPWALVLAYVSNRAIQSRFDSVFGIFGWQNEFKAGPDGGVLCGISVKDPETKEWITKWDGAENTKIEEVKGGLSSAMKRCAVQFSCGRYLYSLPTTFADFQDTGQYSSFVKKNKNSDQGQWLKWNPPRLPAWALPRQDESSLIESKFSRLISRVPEGKRSDWYDAWGSAGTAADKSVIIKDLESFFGQGA